jgi:hypothetical protein
MRRQISLLALHRWRGMLDFPRVTLRHTDDLKLDRGKKQHSGGKP